MFLSALSIFFAKLMHRKITTENNFTTLLFPVNKTGTVSHAGTSILTLETFLRLGALHSKTCGSL